MKALFVTSALMCSYVGANAATKAPAAPVAGDPLLTASTAPSWLSKFSKYVVYDGGMWTVNPNPVITMGALGFTSQQEIHEHFTDALSIALQGHFDRLAQAAAHEAACSNLIGRLDALRAQYEQLTAQFAESQRRMNEGVEAFTKTRSSFDDICSKQKGELSDANATIAGLRQRIVDIQGDLDNANQSHTQAAAEVADQARVIANLQDALSKANERISAQNELLDVLRVKVSIANHALAELVSAGKDYEDSRSFKHASPDTFIEAAPRLSQSLAFVLARFKAATTPESIAKTLQDQKASAPNP
ncbi:MAG: hypothetical protein LBF66_00260 [Holosporales bacterium]|nr:hypothetical protein [Holosporales bacterium]